jgi:hypothetical protein
MTAMNYDANVKLSTYTKYYFALKEYADEIVPERRMKPITLAEMKKLEVLFLLHLFVD